MPSQSQSEVVMTDFQADGKTIKSKIYLRVYEDAGKLRVDLMDADLGLIVQEAPESPQIEVRVPLEKTSITLIPPSELKSDPEGILARMARMESVIERGSALVDLSRAVHFLTMLHAANLASEHGVMEKVRNRICDRYHSASKDHLFVLWVSQSDSKPVRFVSPDEKTWIDWQNFQDTLPPAFSFDPPPDCKRIALKLPPPLSFKWPVQFSSVLTLSGFYAGQSTRQKAYVDGNKLRIEMSSLGVPFVTLIRKDLAHVYFLMPQEKTYVVSAEDPKGSFVNDLRGPSRIPEEIYRHELSYVANLIGILQRNDIPMEFQSQENMRGQLCEKNKLTLKYNPDSEDLTAYLWISVADASPVRLTIDGGMTIDCDSFTSNIPSKEIFDLPSDYQEIR